MKINAQEVLLSNGKFSKKKMGEEPSSNSQEQTNSLKDEPVTNPQDPKAYSIMDAMDLQSRNNINFSALNKIKDVPAENPQEPSDVLKDEPATNPQDPKAYSIMDAMDLQSRNNINFGSLLRKMNEEPTTNSEGAETKQMYSTNLKNLNNINFGSLQTFPLKKYGTLALAAAMLVCTSCKEGLINVNQEVTMDLDGMLAALEKEREETRAMYAALLEALEQQHEDNEALLLLLNTISAKIDTMNAEQLAMMQAILNSTISSDEKLALILDLVGDMDSYLPLLLAEQQQTNALITQSINVQVQNGQISQENQAAILAAMQLLINNSQQGNYIAWRNNQALNALYTLLQQSGITDVSRLLAEIALYAGDMNDAIHNIEINTSNIKENTDSLVAYGQIRIAQGDKIINQLKKANNTATSIKELAESLDLTVAELKDLLAEFSISVEVDATLDPADKNDIINAIQHSNDTLSGQMAQLISLVTAYIAMDDQNSDEAKALLIQIRDKIGDIKCTCTGCGNEGWNAPSKMLQKYHKQLRILDQGMSMDANKSIQDLYEKFPAELVKEAEKKAYMIYNSAEDYSEEKSGTIRYSAAKFDKMLRMENKLTPNGLQNGLYAMGNTVEVVNNLDKTMSAEETLKRLDGYNPNPTHTDKKAFRKFARENEKQYTQKA